MATPELPQPPKPGTAAEPGVRHYAEYIATGPNRYEAVGLLGGWLTDRILDDTDPGDYGELYRVWADIGDLVSAFEDESTFNEVAAKAAQEWLLVADTPRRAEWRARWSAWLGTYHDTHLPFWRRPGFNTGDVRVNPSSRELHEGSGRLRAKGPG